jgi:hypothetical protein
MTVMRYLFVAVAAFLFIAGCGRAPIEQQVRTLGDREFVPGKWAQATSVERQQMLASFFAKYPPKGLTAPRVKELLGAPTA